MLSSEMAHSELLLRRHREACTISDTANVQHLPEPQDPRWQDDCDLGLAMLAVLSSHDRSSDPIIRRGRRGALGHWCAKHGTI